MSDSVNARGSRLRRAPKRKGVPYGGYAQVYESSGAEQPYVWVRVDEAEGGNSAVVHLTLEDALRFAEDILHICNNHYQIGQTDD